MRLVMVTDDEGYKMPYWVQDGTPDHKAKMGIPAMPIDITELDWDEIKRDLHNLMVDRGLFSTDDLTASPGQLDNAIRLVLYRPIFALYLQERARLKEGGSE